MKRTLSTILTVAFLLALIPGVTSCKRVPKNWYEQTLEYFRDGVKNGFKEEYRNMHIGNDIKDKNNHVGYLLVDLDKDGVDELLIGLIDNSPSTKFTNVIVMHSDLGPYSLLSAGNGSYISLCYDGVICMDDSRNNQEFMRWNQKDNAFTIIDGEGKYLPMKWELTEF